MCAPLCDAVLERDDSAQVLEQLESENLFVVALDHQRSVVPLPPPLPGDARGPSSSAASRTSSRRSTAGRPRGARRTASRRWRSSTRPQSGDVDELAALVDGVRVPVLPGRPRHDGRALARRCSTTTRCSSVSRRSRCSASGCTRCAADPTMPSAGRSPSRSLGSTARCPTGARSRAGPRRSGRCSASGASSRCGPTPSSPSAASPRRARGSRTSVLLQGVATLFCGDRRQAEIILSAPPRRPSADGASGPASSRAQSWRCSRSTRDELASRRAELALAEAFVDDAPLADYVVTAIRWPRPRGSRLPGDRARRPASPRQRAATCVRS